MVWPRPHGRPVSPDAGRVGRLLLCVLAQVGSIYALTALGWGQFAGVLLAVVAGQVPMVVRFTVAMAGLAAATVGYGLILSAHAPPGPPLFTAVGFFGFELFAAGAAWFARRESEARAELAQVNAELLATQSLLADSTRVAERLRIARELHDSLGHHLTALALQLEVARNTAGENSAVTKAHELARGMLAEVRRVVGTMRDERHVELGRALEMLVAGIPSPKVHLSFPAGLEVADAEAAHAAFRCVQEAVTNAVRHSGARNVWVTVGTDGRSLRVEVRDDGRGAEEIRQGHGLTGLNERLASIGGVVQVDRPADGGLRVSASIPIRGRAA